MAKAGSHRVEPLAADAVHVQLQFAERTKPVDRLANLCCAAIADAVLRQLEQLELL